MKTKNEYLVVKGRLRKNYDPDDRCIRSTISLYPGAAMVSGVYTVYKIFTECDLRHFMGVNFYIILV
jgi:hypothetical protein